MNGPEKRVHQSLIAPLALPTTSFAPAPFSIQMSRT